MRKVILMIAVGAALAVPTAASASVHLVHLTSPISHGFYATLRVSVPQPATCSITVVYKSGPSEAAGLVRLGWNAPYVVRRYLSA